MQVKTKNLFLTGALTVVMLIAMLFGFTACGDKPLTEADVIGKWEVTNITYTAHADSTYASDTCTKAEWEVLNAKTTDKTAEDDIKFDIFEDKFYTYELKEDKTIDQWFEGTAYAQKNVTWALNDGQVTISPRLNGSDVTAVEMKDGKLMITFTDTPEQSGIPGVFVFTLEKVVE